MASLSSVVRGAENSRDKSGKGEFPLRSVSDVYKERCRSTTSSITLNDYDFLEDDVVIIFDTSKLEKGECISREEFWRLSRESERKKIRSFGAPVLKLPNSGSWVTNYEVVFERPFRNLFFLEFLADQYIQGEGGVSSIHRKERLFSVEKVNHSSGEFRPLLELKHPDLPEYHEDREDQKDREELGEEFNIDDEDDGINGGDDEDEEVKQPDVPLRIGTLSTYSNFIVDNFNQRGGQFVYPNYEEFSTVEFGEEEKKQFTSFNNNAEGFIASPSEQIQLERIEEETFITMYPELPHADLPAGKTLLISPSESNFTSEAMILSEDLDGAVKVYIRGFEQLRLLVILEPIEHITVIDCPFLDQIIVDSVTIRRLLIDGIDIPKMQRRHLNISSLIINQGLQFDLEVRGCAINQIQDFRVDVVSTLKMNSVPLTE